MRILNVGCGNLRPSAPFINLDNLREQHAVGSPERAMLDDEPNYVEHNLLSGPLPFPDEDFDSVALLHCLEHFDAQRGWKLMADCRRVMKPGGTLLVSVPDASYFRKVDAEDRNENWPQLFGQTDPNNPIPTFRQAALFFEQHPVVLTEDALWCYFRQAGFEAAKIRRIDPFNAVLGSEAEQEMCKIVNRQKFSLLMAGVK